jgi:hypothetical protein
MWKTQYFLVQGYKYGEYNLKFEKGVVRTVEDKETRANTKEAIHTEKK